MTLRIHPHTRRVLRPLLATCLASTPLLFAQDAEEENDVVELSPFQVSTEGDRGYFAANTVSGSRIDVPIQDIPLALEVVTSEFIEDTGATDLRESLAYSAGIVLQSQNDALRNDSFSGIGGVNNPEGVTRNRTDTSYKLRGFVTESSLRYGFLRQSSTDSVNIDRIEILRGPSALLYGIGNFGGIVNYMIKEPLADPLSNYTAGMGSDGFFRFTADVSNPVNDEFGYRVSFAAETAGDQTELYGRHHYFISPITVWKPSKRTKIIVDFEFGEDHQEGIGFQSVRTPSIEIPFDQPDRMETYGLLEFPDKDVRSFRWSGPDTYLDTMAWNLHAEWQQKLLEGLNFSLGANLSHVEFSGRDVFGSLQIQDGADDEIPAEIAAVRGTIQARQIVDGSTSDIVTEVDNVYLLHHWLRNEESNDRAQIRGDFNYKIRLFDDNRWLASDHSILAGMTYDRNDRFVEEFTESDFYKSPTDSSYIRYQPSDLVNSQVTIDSVAENWGSYFVYSGRFLQDRMFVVAGLRNDVNRTQVGNDDPSEWLDILAQQVGVSFEVIDGVTLFAVRSQGVSPNFDGYVDGWGNPIEAATATNKEYGIKLNLFGGKVSVSASAYTIEREGVPYFYWWGPAPINGNFDRNADIVYRLDDFNADAKTDNRYIQAGKAAWDAAKASGAIYEAENPNDGNTYWYVNASKADGAAYLDAVFASLNAEFALPADQRTDGDPWPGWLYAGIGAGEDPNVNTASSDWAASGGQRNLLNDSAKGWEMQVLLSPTDSFQMIFNYSHLERQIDAPGAFPEYDYADGNWDRWTMWYFPNSAWGLTGFQPEDVYPGGSNGLPNSSTSSWTGIGYGGGESLDDSPKHVVSTWMNYRIKSGPTAGLSLGLGAIWESEREYASAFTSSGQKKLTDSTTKIQAFTDPRLTINAMVKYEFEVGTEHPAFFQLNINNLGNDTNQYGLIYAPGLSWRCQFGMDF